MTIQRKLIEYDLPLAEISQASAREKNIRHGHPSTLHSWWARRPLASSRATAFAALMDDPGAGKLAERERLLALVREITPWEAVKGGNSAAIRRRLIIEARRLIREQYGYAPRVLDWTLFRAVARFRPKRSLLAILPRRRRVPARQQQRKTTARRAADGQRTLHARQR